MDGDKYFIVKKKAVPEVLLKVVEAKRLLASERALTVQEATEAVEISRSSFYKYRDDIFPFYENTRGKLLQLCFRWMIFQDYYLESRRGGANLAIFLPYIKVYRLMELH